MSNQTYFQDEGLEDDKFSSWVAQVLGDNKNAKCKVCRKSFELSSMGRGAFTSHQTKSEKLNCLMKNLSAFLVKPKPKSSVDNRQDSGSNKSNDACGETNKKNRQQATLEVVMNNSEKLKTEIIWTLKTVSIGYSNNSSKDISNLFYAMFPGSKIAEDMRLGADKVKYVINFGIVTVFKNTLTGSIKKSELYDVSFDESLNDNTKNCEMDVIICYFDVDDNKIKTCYLDSCFLGHSTHTDLLREYNKALEDLCENKLIQISMDGLNVNLKLLGKINEERTSNEFHRSISIGSCGLYMIHGAFDAGAEATE